jgi:hypothetical protein
MITDEILIVKAKKLIEARLGWGESADWTNQDFIALSNRFRDEKDVSVSHATLKRIWGKVKYEGLPQTYTLNALAIFAGYENWRDFKVKNGNDPAITEIPSTIPHPSCTTKHEPKRPGLLKWMSLAVILILTGTVLFIYDAKEKIDPADYSFTITKVLKAGIPNSVIFNFNADKAPSDSVILQQSWDSTRRTVVSKAQHQHTLIYYFPGFFKPKLIVGGEVVKEQDLLLPSDGWLAAIQATPMPVYFNKKDFFANGIMTLTADQLKAQNISMSPQAPLLSFCNVQDFGEIYTDHFSFETSLRNDYGAGSSVCQMTNIYLLCEGTAIGIPLCAKGCQSNINFFFAGFSVSGKQKDLSAFGVDFNEFVKVKVESENGKAGIFINDRPVYEVPDNIARSKIIGIDFVFQGTGSVDFVKLSNGKVFFSDEF